MPRGSWGTCLGVRPTVTGTGNEACITEPTAKRWFAKTSTFTDVECTSPHVALYDENLKFDIRGKSLIEFIKRSFSPSVIGPKSGWAQSAQKCIQLQLTTLTTQFVLPRETCKTGMRGGHARNRDALSHRRFLEPSNKQAPQAPLNCCISCIS